MKPRVSNPVAAYGVACLCLAAAFLCRWAFTPIIGDTAPFMLFILAAIFSAVFGGFGPGVLTAVAGQFLAHYFFIAPHHTFLPADLKGWVYWTLYDVVVLLCLILVEMLHRATKRAEANSQRAARQEEQLRTIIREMSATQERVRELAAVVESAEDAIISTNSEGRVVNWNVGAERLFGFSGWEMVGQLLIRTVPEDRQVEYAERLSRVLAGESTAAMETVRLTRTGQLVDVSVRLSPLRDGTGKVRGVSAISRDISEAKRAQAEISRLNYDLERHLDETRQIMEVLPVGVAIAADPGCQQVEVNQTLATMLGLSADDFLPGDGVSDALILKDPQTLLGHLPLRSAAVGDREIGGVEASLHRPDGSSIDVLGQAVPLRDSAGQVRGVVGACINITELKRAHAALKETEQRFRTMADTAPLMIWMTDAVRGSAWVNKTWRTFTGRERELESAEGWEEPIHPDDRSAWKQSLEAAARDKNTFEIEYRLRRADGEMRWVLDRGVPRFGGDGEFLGYIGSCVDVTERKQAEVALEKKFDELRSTQHALREQNEELARNRRALETERARYQELFDSAPIGYIITTRQGVIEQVNGAAAELLNESPQFLQGFPFARLLAKPDRASFFSTIGRLTRREVSQVTGWEAVIEPQGRTAFPCSITVNLVHDEENQLVGLRWILRDITERKEVEQRILKLNGELEQRVRERTAALEAANHEMEAFSYSVSHDLRAPLRSINGFSRALLEEYSDRLDEQGIKYLQHACDASVRMNRLIEDLLELSRVSRGELRRQDVDLTALAKAVVNDIRGSSPKRQVEVVVHPGLRVSADAGLLRIVLENLIGNAWKFTNGRVPARIEVGSLEKEGRPCFFVRDNGAGFEMRNASRLFGVFQRLHSQEEFPGIGIGLATVKRVVTRHGGEVWAEGKVGAGASFYFALPVPVSEPGPSISENQPQSLSRASTASPDSNPARKLPRRRAQAIPSLQAKPSEGLLKPAA